MQGPVGLIGDEPLALRDKDDRPSKGCKAGRRRAVFSRSRPLVGLSGSRRSAAWQATRRGMRRSLSRTPMAGAMGHCAMVAPVAAMAAGARSPRRRRLLPAGGAAWARGRQCVAPRQIRSTSESRAPLALGRWVSQWQDGQDPLPSPKPDARPAAPSPACTGGETLHHDLGMVADELALDRFPPGGGVT